MDEVFPLIRKYGGVVVGLTIDEEGIPKDAEGRVRVAGKIINRSSQIRNRQERYRDRCADHDHQFGKGRGKGYPGSTEEESREEFGVRTVLGVSNISFGLPRRPIVNSYFYAMAMQNGLTCRNHQSILRRYDESLSFL